MDKESSQTKASFTVLTLEIDLGKRIRIGPIPSGLRTAVPILGGAFEGPRLHGVVCPIGLGWSTQNTDGSCLVRGSVVLCTEDGAMIALHYSGHHSPPDCKHTDLSEAPSLLKENHLMTMSCRLECGDKRYEWLNSAFAVADGRCSESGITCRLFAVAR